MRLVWLALFTLAFCFSGVAQRLMSPDGKLALNFKLNSEREPIYNLSFNGDPVIKNSKLGFRIKGQPRLERDFRITEVARSENDKTWNPVWGEVKTIRNHYREMAVTLEQTAVGEPESEDDKNEKLFVSADNSRFVGKIKRTLVVRFRLFNDGLGFRYEFPNQEQLKYFQVTKESTEFNLNGDHKAFWIPGDYDTNEYAYNTSKLSQVNAFKGKNVGEISTRVLFADNAVQTPLMMKSGDGLYINIHEAALQNYPVMYMLVDRKTYGLSTHLAPNAVGTKAFLQTPAKTPWRTILVSDAAADILDSKMILNLNEPSKVKNPSWIKPQKMIGIWWELHINKSSWNYADVSNVKIDKTDFSKLKPNGRHGANNKNVKRYIDFAAKNDIDGVLVEGWNVGWEDWFGNWKENVFDFITPYPDFDVGMLNKYAASKGVKLIMHHETSASASNYERRLPEAFRFMNKHGYDTVKTGYVGRIIPRGEYHDGQVMNEHYIHVASEAIKHEIMIDSHESSRPTGLHRTYPNWLTSEAARGNEFNAWSSGNPPEHETILPFTRLIGGPMDYTPGIFEIKMSRYNPDSSNQVHTTLAKQLALYVTIYSPLQMAADLPENYESRMDAFQFIRDVAVDWDDTRILDAEPGDYLTIARKAKGSEEWFVGAITDENRRVANIPLSFLDPGREYVATVYMDAKDADWKKNPMAYQIKKYVVVDSTNLKIILANGGGAAISIKPASKNDLRSIREY
ncbi:MAG: glycoside hydrolase family 97 protein [Pyrinomonadaceae bacterium]|nr:glycoside hydrolase family 97 protein [Pyrinomonadaceae bacterium]